MDKKKKYMWIIVIIDDVFKEEMINIYDNICQLDNKHIYLHRVNFNLNNFKKSKIHFIKSLNFS